MSFMTLSQYLIEQGRQNNAIDADLRLLIETVASACKTISYKVGKGAIDNVLGSLDSENVQGEVQKKLDVVTNDILLDANKWGGCLRAMASEEMETIQAIPDTYPRGDYLLLFDPLDGSSNIDVNVSIGTIFSVLKAPSDHNSGAVAEADFLQPGAQQCAAGYAIYGPQTMLVLTLGSGVVAFTLNKDTGTWALTRDAIRIPDDTAEFSINMSNQRHWENPVRRYIDECLAGSTGPLEKDYNMRWIASMVADVHRILSRGGIFMYPRDERASGKQGKLRLMYEANPMAFVVEQAGGLAVDGAWRILDITPQGLHQRVGVILGSRNEVERVQGYHQQP